MEPAEFYLLTASYRNCSCGVGGDDIRYLAISVLGVFTSAGAWTFTACLDGLTDFDEISQSLLDTLPRATLGCPGPLKTYHVLPAVKSDRRNLS